ncbi:CHASE3 domain-containing protein [Alteromonas halophila]|uniref:histidine kinase n=1 Tax=Alteromonas halophila TaxID=516698 RepID=A0A918MXJ5_9ALTE|nr:CHASE3 domain-containing protein [Alteromonas halophila]GGW82640.1 hypothetical protein GCM10007391_14670 [Alteromonas halophila]
MQFSLRQSFSVFITLAIVAGLLSISVVIVGNQNSKQSEKWLTHTYEVLTMSSHLLTSLKDAETGQRGYLLTSKERYLEPYHAGVKSSRDTLQKLFNKTSDNPRQQQRLSELSDLIDQKLQKLEQTVNLAKNGQKAEAMRIVNTDIGRELMDEISALLDAFDREENQLLAQRREKYDAMQYTELITILLAILSLISLMAFATHAVKRRVINPIISLTDQSTNYLPRVKNEFSAQNAATEIQVLANTLQLMSDNLYKVISNLNEDKITAEARAKVKADFLANMSHEIRTPLNGINGTLQLLADEVSTDKGKDLLHKAKYSAFSLITIVNDILDLSKFEAGKLRVEETDFRLSELAEHVMSDMGMLAHKKGLRINFRNKTEHDYWIGDPVRIRQILINIISNAVKFTHHGIIEFTIDHVAGSDEIEFTVVDPGIGMTDEQLSRLFERFEQADRSTTRKYGGTGLGMSITKLLVDLMHGRIDVVSQAGKGSSFNVTLPLKRSQLTIQPRTHTDDVDINLSGKRILAAEDNEINRMIIQEMLRKTGADLALAENGLLAVEEFKAKPFDIVLLDIQMPEMDGLEACKIIKQHNDKVPVIAVTANVLSEDKHRYENSGFNDYLAKPMSKDMLYAKLSEYLLN